MASAREGTATGTDKGKRIVGVERQTLAKDFVKRYTSGESIRALAASTGRSYGFVHRVLTESGVQLRQRSATARRRQKPKPTSRTSKIPTQTRVDRMAGGIVRIDHGSGFLVLVEHKRQEQVVSWTAHCSAVAFVNICETLPGVDLLAGSGVLAVGSVGRYTGTSGEVLAVAATTPAATLRRKCDFVRIDVPSFGVAYHDFSLGAPAAANRRIVSLVIRSRDRLPLDRVLATAATSAIKATVLKVVDRGGTP